MKKNAILKIINPILGLLFINQILTGIFGRQLPLGMFEIFHKKAAVVFACVVVVHLILNWNWIKANYFKRAATDKNLS
jgi:hypothetical protein